MLLCGVKNIYVCLYVNGCKSLMDDYWVTGGEGKEKSVNRLLIILRMEFLSIYLYLMFL